MFVNPNMFFQIKDGQIVAWDFKNHQQFILEDAYFQRLKAWANDPRLTSVPIDKELEEGLLLSKEQTPESEWGWDALSWIFHVGTRDIAEECATLQEDEWIEQYLKYCEGIAESFPPMFTRKQGETVALPVPKPHLFDKRLFFDALKKRKTCRSFKGEPISSDILSALLFTSLGQIHGQEWDELKEKNLAELGLRKAFPSGGGLHPEEAYIVALQVDGVEPGVYHYRCEDHTLTLLRKGDFEERVIQLLYGQYFAKGLACGIFLTARFEKSWWKYPHSRGYRVVLLDVGHASQTLLLTATALGLNTWLTAAFSDSGVEEFLELQGATEAPIMFVGVGYGDNAAIDAKMLARVSERSQ